MVDKTTITPSKIVPCTEAAISQDELALIESVMPELVRAIIEDQTIADD